MPEKSRLASLIDAVSCMVFEKPKEQSEILEQPVVHKKRYKKPLRAGSFDLDW